MSWYVENGKLVWLPVPFVPEYRHDTPTGQVAYPAAAGVASIATIPRVTMNRLTAMVQSLLIFCVKIAPMIVGHP